MSGVLDSAATRDPRFSGAEVAENCFISLRKRYESYSETEDLNIYYNYYSKDKTKIMIITAFKL